MKENCAYENVYTLALRGLHDAAMGGGDVPMREKVKMLESALNAQRDIIARHIDKPVETIPQAFTPYKEVLEIYSNGLELPDDVTIIWADDNFGYMKRLSIRRNKSVPDVQAFTIIYLIWAFLIAICGIVLPLRH